MFGKISQKNLQFLLLFRNKEKLLLTLKNPLSIASCKAHTDENKLRICIDVNNI